MKKIDQSEKMVAKQGQNVFAPSIFFMCSMGIFAHWYRYLINNMELVLLATAISDWKLIWFISNIIILILIAKFIKGINRFALFFQRNLIIDMKILLHLNGMICFLTE